MQFPQYRKYKGHHIFFKIVADDHFEELKIVGEKYQLFDVRATIYPEKLRILDMLNNVGDYWDTIEPAEYDERLSYAKQHLKKL